VDPLPAPLRPAGPERVEVHSSLRGLAAAVLTPIALIALGAAALASGGSRTFPTLLLAGGLVLAAVVLADFPRRSEFDLRGITRVCWLRRQHIPWDRVVAIERSRPSTASHARNLADRRSSSERVVSGGLVARGAKRRRWLLTDRVESREEHRQLTALLERVERPVTMRAPTPHEGAPPTDLYRRRQRRPPEDR
jgi:hypothetical protein